MKIIITENQKKRLEFKYLDYLFDGMEEFHSEKFPDSRLWKKNNNVILELEKSGDLWVFHPIWSDISDMFSLGYGNTRQLIKEWVEQRLKLEGITPTINFDDYYDRWDNI